MGAPVLESSISLIQEGRLYYRGHDAVTLAEQNSVEEVATLIWLGEIKPFPDERAEINAQRLRAIGKLASGLPPMEAFQLLVPIAAIEDLAAYDLRAAGVAQTGARILKLFAAITGGNGASSASSANSKGKASTGIARTLNSTGCRGTRRPRRSSAPRWCFQPIMN